MPAAPANRSRHSIRRSLLRWVFLSLLLLAVIVCGLTWLVATRHAAATLDRSLDAQVRALAALVQPGMQPQNAIAAINAPIRVMAQLEQEDQPVCQITIHPATPTAPAALIAMPAPVSPLPDRLEANTALFYTAMQAGKERRVVVFDQALDGADGSMFARIQLARSTAPYHADAQMLMGRILLPMLALVLLLGAGMVLAVQRGLWPLRQLADEIDGIRSGDLHPVVVPQAPQEVQAITDALNHLLSSAQNNVDSEKRFINDAAHQLRTPLAGLISQSELALGETSPEALRQRIQKMHGAAQRSAHLVQQMLALARTEGAPLHKPMPYDIAALAREMAREWTPRALAAHMDLGYEGEARAEVPGDRTLMREAIGNLIDNALHYAGRDAEITVRVLQHAKAGKPQIVLEVADNGPGVAPEHLPKLFQRFWRAEESAPGGCGIGLALVERVATLHHGTAHATLNEPHGLIVRLVLPQQTRHMTTAPRLPPPDWDYDANA